MDIYIREACNGHFKIIVRRKNWYWMKAEETFSDMYEALEVVRTLVRDIVSGATGLGEIPVDKMAIIETDEIVPEPNATKVYKVLLS